MISIEDQQNLLLAIAKKLKNPITVYAIGGTAMMFWGLKDATLDIDLVFEKNRDKEDFKNAAKDIGYEEMNLHEIQRVYGEKTNCPEMLMLGKERFDLFVVSVIDFVFSDTMKKRAEKTYQYGQNLIIKVADPHDIILMKCATDRAKDRGDILKIINEQKIDWNIIVEEAKKQVALGKKRAIFDLGSCLAEVKNIKKGAIPSKIIDQLYELLDEQKGS